MAREIGIGGLSRVGYSVFTDFLFSVSRARYAWFSVGCVSGDSYRARVVYVLYFFGIYVCFFDSSGLVDRFGVVRDGLTYFFTVVFGTCVHYVCVFYVHYMELPYSFVREHLRGCVFQGYQGYGVLCYFSVTGFRSSVLIFIRYGYSIAW